MADPTGILVNIALQSVLRLAIAALTPKQHTEGPRLEDRNVTTSTYGEVIPIGYATSNITGNVIWGRKIREVKKKHKIGKGDPFSVGTATEYFYYADFAVGLALREADNLIRIYADGKLIYATDTDSGVPEKMKGLNFRFYKGSETQEPDPLISEDYEDGEVPAYRGLCYVVFNDLPLDNFGRRIPQFEFVVSFDADESPIDPVSMQFPTGAAPGFRENALYDADRKRVYAIGLPDGEPSGYYYLLEFNSETGALLRSKLIWELSQAAGYRTDIGRGYFTNTNCYMYGNKGPYIVLALDRGPHLCVEKSTLELAGSSADNYICEWSGSHATDCQVVPYTSWCYGRDGLYFLDTTGGGLVVPISNSQNTSYVLFGGSDGYLNFSIWDVDSYNYINPYVGGRSPRGIGYAARLPTLDHKVQQPPADPYIDVAPCYGFLGCCEGYQGDGWTDVYSMHNPSKSNFDHYYIVRNRIDKYGNIDRKLMYVHLKWDFLNLFSILLDTYLLDSAVTTPMMTYDPDTDSLLIANNETRVYNVDSQGKDFNNPSGAGPVFMEQRWETSSYARPANTKDLSFWGGGGEWALRDGSESYFYSMKDGKLLSSHTGVTGDGTSSAFFDPVRNRMLNIASNKINWTYLKPGLFRGTESLKTVVDDILSRSKLTTDLYNTTALASVEVKGYTIARETTFRAALEPLATAYNFYAVENAGELVFNIKGTATDVTVPEDDLLRDGPDASVVEESLTQEAEMPYAVYLEYQTSIEPDTKSVQGASRIADPVATMNAKSEVRYQMPLILSDQEASDIVYRVLYETWVEQEGFKFRLPQRYLELLPNDVMAVTAQGRTENVRASRVSISADLTMEVEGAITDGDLYSLNAFPAERIGSPNYGRANTVIDQTDLVSTGFLLDVPLLSDSYAEDRTKGGLILAAAADAYGSEDFDGAGFLVSVDGGPYDLRVATGDGMAWGVLRDSMPDLPHVDFNGVQEASIVVSILGGESYFTSVTQAQMIGEDANTAILYQPATGNVEVIGFRDAEVYNANLGDNSVTLTGFMRGKRGTDALAYWPSTLPIYIIVANALWIEGFLAELSLNDATISYVSAAPGQTPESSDARDLTLNLRSLMPYAPCHVEITQTSETDPEWEISWTRRTRIGGAWNDLITAVHLGEGSEAYEVDILDGSGGSVLRTLSATIPSVVYTEAMGFEDFGTSGTPATLYVRVYQISEEVGRGFSNEYGLET